MNQIEVIINPDGSMHVEAQGYHGKKCSLDIAKLLQALEAEGKTEKHKPEFYECERLHQQQG